MKLTPAATRRTSACFGPGTGVGTSSSVIASGPPCWCTRIAFILDSSFLDATSYREGELSRQVQEHWTACARHDSMPRATIYECSTDGEIPRADGVPAYAGLSDCASRSAANCEG